MSYVGFDSELLQVIEAWKALEMPVFWRFQRFGLLDRKRRKRGVDSSV
jgi:hypothetical protein